jgi:hypothetical protein
MGRKKLNNKRTSILSTRVINEESDKICFISRVLGMNVARFISMCIQEWLSNHSDFIKLVNKEFANESRREAD